MDLFPTLSKEFWIGFLVTIAVNIIILTGIDRIFRVVGSTYREVGIAVTTGLFGDLRTVVRAKGRSHNQTTPDRLLRRLPTTSC